MRCVGRRNYGTVWTFSKKPPPQLSFRPVFEKSGSKIRRSHWVAYSEKHCSSWPPLALSRRSASTSSGPKRTETDSRWKMWGRNTGALRGFWPGAKLSWPHFFQIGSWTHKCSLISNNCWCSMRYGKWWYKIRCSSKLAVFLIAGRGGQCSWFCQSSSHSVSLYAFEYRIIPSIHLRSSIGKSW